MRTPPAYDEDLAYIHDVGYGFHANGLAPYLLRLLKRETSGDGVIVDLGCGSGIWARHLQDAGLPAIGVDLSPAMIALAQRCAPSVEFHVASLVDYRLPRCRAITALGEVVCYQLDRRNNRRALGRLLQQAHRALFPGGLLIFDIAETGLDRGRLPSARVGGDWACLVQYEYDDRHDRLTRRIVTFRRVGEYYRRGEEQHRIQLYDAREVATLLRDIGFRVQTLRRFGNYNLVSGRVGFIARKPSR